MTVKANAKKAEVTQLDNGEYRIAVREPAQNGKANQAVVELIARHFGIPKSAVKVTRGFSSRHKLLELETS